MRRLAAAFGIASIAACRPIVVRSVSRAPTPHARLDEKLRDVQSLAKLFGVSDIYVYGVDEATGQRLLDEWTAWGRAHDRHPKVFVVAAREAPDHLRARKALVNASPTDGFGRSSDLDLGAMRQRVAEHLTRLEAQP